MDIKILTSDILFYDSPNAGERGCICSRCKKMIEEHEVPLRAAISKENLYHYNEKGEKITYPHDEANGIEFRLCEKCTDNLRINTIMLNNEIRVRFNTEHNNGQYPKWRAIIGNDEMLVDAVIFDTQCRTTEDMLPDGRIKHHVAATYNQLLWEEYDNGKHRLIVK